MIDSEMQKKLRENPLVAQALEQAKSEDDQKKILAIAEQFLEAVLDLATISSK